MTLDNIMTMAKADRYTEEGRQIVNDARRTYKPGEISEATGLQKQSNGTWAPPKKGAPKGAKNTAKEKAAGAEIKEGQKEAAKTKPSEKWTSTPSGRVNTIKTPEGSATVTWNKEKNGEEWYGISTVKNHKMNSSDKHYKTIEEAKVAAEEELQGKQKDPEQSYAEFENAQDIKMSNAYKWNDMIRGAVNGTPEERKQAAEAIEKQYKQLSTKKLSPDEKGFIEQYYKKSQEWLQGDVPEGNVAANKMPKGYVSSLDEKTQNQLKDALKKQLKDDGMDRLEIAEAIENMMDSKVSDLQDVWNGNHEVKTILWNANKTNEEAKVAAEEELQGKQKDPMEEMRNTDRPLSTMENQIDEGSYDDAIIESEGDSTAIMDISRDILSPAFDAVPDQEIPESWLKAARDSVRKRYTALRKDVMGDSAPRTLTGDTKIRVKK